MNARTNPAGATVDILIADDSPTQAERLRYLLEQHGYRVTLASNGKHALACLNGTKPALVISDINMPEMNGFELCQRLKEDERTRDIPVVLLTSLSSAQDVVDGLVCGADSFITKPYSEDYLLAYVERTLADESARPSGRAGVEVEIPIPGASRLITADPQRLVGLLLSTYGAAVHRNSELARTQDELRSMTERLEDLVEQRTTALSAEIVERRQAEAKLRESEERYRTLAESAHDMIFIVNRVGHLEYLNDFGASLFGRPAKDIVGQPLGTLFPPETVALQRENLQQVFDTLEPLSTEDKISFPHGDVWLGTSLVPLRDESGQAHAIMGIARDITQRKRRDETLRHRLAALEALHTVSAALRVAQTRNEALPLLLDETLAVLGTDTGAIWLHDESGADELRPVASRGWHSLMGDEPTRPGEGIAGTVFATGLPHISREFAADPLTNDLARPLIPAGWGGACVPIRAGSETVGVLLVSVLLPRQITTEQVNLLESLTEMAGAALHRMRLHEETVRQLNQLQALHSIDLAITSSPNLSTTLNVILEQATTQLNVDAASILLLDPNQYTFEYAAGRGFRTEALQHTHLRFGEGYAGRAALERKLIHIPDLRQRKTDFLRSPYFSTEGFVAYCGAPLVAHEQVVGVLEVFHRAPLPAGPDWIRFLEMLARQAAIAIDNAQLLDSLQRSNADLTAAYDATLEGWSRALDLRDRETEGHTLRVTEMTLRLAGAVGMSDEDLGYIQRGALLHDIGKMGIPDSILLKPGPLDDDEWVIMREHPTYAHKLLSPITYLQLSMDIPYCHHEKWDGTGYPRGLRGEEIPLAARLFAVVDVWDALRSDRPYRAAWPPDRVREHIRSLSGVHFDPQVAEAFLALESQPRHP